MNFKESRNTCLIAVCHGVLYFRISGCSKLNAIDLTILETISLARLIYEYFGLSGQWWTIVSSKQWRHWVYVDRPTTRTGYDVQVSVTQCADDKGSIILVVSALKCSKYFQNFGTTFVVVHKHFIAISFKHLFQWIWNRF